MNGVMFSVITCQRVMVDHICKLLIMYGKSCMVPLQCGHRGSLTHFSFH